MYPTLAALIDRLDSHRLADQGVISWGSPVPAFGDPSCARVATLGINPSNREFVDEYGAELEGPGRRFHTLRSLNIDSWVEADSRHLERIVESCVRYFHANPYDRWFARLDGLLGGLGSSFYGPSANACHLDLIPYATVEKWTHLSACVRTRLLHTSCDALGSLLRDSSIQLLVLNGRGVVDRFEELTQISFERQDVVEWALPRRSGADVMGTAFSGTVSMVGAVHLGRPVKVLGYNHNIQSSFGVTSQVVSSIRDWLAT